MYKCDVRRVYVLVHGCVCVCASHADEMKWRLKNICASRTQIPTIRKGYMCSSLAALHVSLT